MASTDEARKCFLPVFHNSSAVHRSELHTYDHVLSSIVSPIQIRQMLQSNKMVKDWSIILPSMYLYSDSSMIYNTEESH